MNTHSLRFIIPAACLLLQTVFSNSYGQPVNVNLSNGIFFDGEPYIAINPVNNRNLVVSWMGLVFSGGQFVVSIKTRASFDGGVTWSTTAQLPHMGAGYGSADVSMAFDRNGTLYICYIDYRQAPDSGGVYVARSLNGGISWDTPSKAFDMYDEPVKRPIDRPWLVVDNSNSSNSGTLYITSKPAPWIAPPNRNYFKVSSDSGHTWTPIANVDGGTHLIGNLIAAPMAAPATTINGKFCAVYPSYVATQNPLPALYLASSFNKGQTFNYSTVYAAIPAANDTNFKLGYQLICHPTDSNKMIFISPDAQNGDSDVQVYRSGNGGVSWNGPVRVNNDVVGNGKAQDMVWGSYNEIGNIVVTWRDRRNSPVQGFWNSGYDFYYAVSGDNGQTFTANQKMTSQFVPFDSLIAENGNDFMSCTYSGDTLYSVWGDTRNGIMSIYFIKTIASTNTNVGFAVLDDTGKGMRCYPNPVSKNLFVDLDTTFNGKPIVIYDESGKKVYEAVIHGNEMTLDVERFLAGTYLIMAGETAQRFIKK